MTTLDAGQWTRPTDLAGMHQLLNDVLNALWGYDVHTHGPAECVKALQARADRLANLVDEDTAQVVDRLTAHLEQTHSDLSHMRTLVNVWERRARECATPADETRWAFEDKDQADA